MRRTIIRALSHLAPQWVTHLAYQQLTNPQLRKLRPHELKVLEQAQQEEILFAGFRIKTYHWAGGGEKVLLIHGWEGQAGNFGELVEQLQAQNFDVYAFDGPSHGFSSRGKTSLFEFTELVGAMIWQVQPTHLVSHSFGGVATTYALFKNPDLSVRKYALLTTPDQFSQRIADVAQQVGITEGVKQRLIQRLEDETQLDVQTLNVSRFVQSIQVEQALILHDKNDRVIPIQQSRDVANNWAVCTLEEIEGTGHFRILRTPSVLDRVLDFMQQ